MKNLITLLAILTLQNGFAQFKKDEGIVVRYTKNVDVTYSIYYNPLRINQVKSQSEINYSNPEGLIQSFFSASNREWALSEYLDKRTKIVRDEEHFIAVKNNDTSKNYIQMEMVYEYEYENRKMAYVKYAYIMEKIPFPIIGILSVENVNNKWYISDLLNQEYIINILSNFDLNILLELLQGTSNDVFIKDLIKNTRSENGSMDFIKMDDIYNNWLEKNEKEKLFKVKDKRLTLEGHPFRTAQLNEKPSIYKIQGTSQSYILDKCYFLEYGSKSNILINNEKYQKKYLGEPEFNLISNDTIRLIHKFSFEDKNNIFSIIKYKSNDNIKSILLKKDGDRYNEVSNQFKTWIDLFKSLKTKTFYDLYNKSESDIILDRIKEKVFEEGSILNIEKLAIIIKENKASLSKYLDE